MQQILESQVGLPWLVRLRWFALAGQMAFLLAAHIIFSPTLPWRMISCLLITGLISNGALQLWSHAHPHSPRASQMVGGILTLDTLLLAGLLGASGGATNPFSVLFLVHITLAATLLGARWTLLIALLSVLCFGALFIFPSANMQGTSHSMHAHHTGHGAHDGFAAHLHGMWIAFTLTTVLVAFFVSRIAHTIAQQRNQLASLRESAARNARLASLTTLAAGAAHELGTPLGTIAIAARDLELSLAAAHLHDLRDDAKLILAEVERCRNVLGKLASRTDHDHNHHLCPMSELLDALPSRIGDDLFARLHVACDAACHSIKVPREHVLQALVALIKNAADATDARIQAAASAMPSSYACAFPIAVRVTRQQQHLCMSVMDQGTGMAQHILGRAGEPFFTTKEPGRGLGLGLFLVRAFAESHGGHLHIDSTEGQGTCATLLLTWPNATQGHSS